jgi:hypothetical protein
MFLRNPLPDYNPEHEEFHLRGNNKSDKRNGIKLLLKTFVL